MSKHRFSISLWFDDNAEEAVNHYLSIFKRSRIIRTARHTGVAPTPIAVGEPLSIEFELDGQRFVAINGGPQDWQFNEAISIVVNCQDQDEVDEYYSKLLAGGEESVCGWLKDRYGVSWQITPVRLEELMADDDTARVRRVTEAMMKMKKIDIATLERAAEGHEALV